MERQSARNISELRKDPVSGEWVIIATGRAKRPHEFKREEKAKGPVDSGTCPLEDPEKSGNEVVHTLEHVAYEDGWWVKVIKNKFPIVAGSICGLEERKGPYVVQPGAGYNEVVITRDHERSFGTMSVDEVLGVVGVYMERYRALKELDCARYILIFHNHGPEAGASLPHPHSQIIALPIIPPDVRRSLKGSEKYFAEHGECVHCATLAWERDEGIRIVYENEHMVVLSPYAPRDEFALRIYPKIHASSVEDSGPKECEALADALRTTLVKLFKGLGDPPYNFFIHTTPARGAGSYEHYHWHVEILPKPPTPAAGFELATGVDISAVDPDDVAEYLRGIPV